MCTIVLLRRPDHDWPLILAANRDELQNRPWLLPSRHWPDRAEVTAGQDALSKGTWLGINDWGLISGVLNRSGTLGPVPEKRSRGELPLEALEHADANTAAKFLGDINPSSYQSFNLIIADNTNAFWLSSNVETSHVIVKPIPKGLSMITSFDLNDKTSPRIEYYKPKFEAAIPPNPSIGKWDSWQNLMNDSREIYCKKENGSMKINSDRGFCTVSSSLLALPGKGLNTCPKWLFANGGPDKMTYNEIVL